MRRLTIWLGALLAAVAVAISAWFASLLAAARWQPADAVRLAAPHGVAEIDRDPWGVPHIRAATIDDAFYAQGYAMAQDRLFQMDLVRRSVAGELAEVFGPKALKADQKARLIQPRLIARRNLARMSPFGRHMLAAFADGVNAAMDREPLPAEFQLLGYRPRPWTPEDSAMAGLATILVLTYDWNDILQRQRVNEALGPSAASRLYPYSDPRYDVPLVGAIGDVRCDPPPLTMAARRAVGDVPVDGNANAEASNNWAIGADRSFTGHALVVNDPHLDYNVPGVWYLVSMDAPGFHVSGASLAGTPGVILGHTAGLAWGVTNATASTVTVYREPLSAVRDAGSERINVRFGAAGSVHHERTRHGFVFDKDASWAYAAQWLAEDQTTSPLDTFLTLDRANTIEEALAALRSYPGPPQNFVFGDRSGRVAYHMGGFIPDDGVWSTGVVDGARVADARKGFVPFDDLPHVAPSRDAVVFTANNRVVGAPYRYRLTDQFVPAYRAFRIAQLLRAQPRFGIGDMRRMQLDVFSYADQEFARDLATYLSRSTRTSERVSRVARELAQWDGRMSGYSWLATLVSAERRATAKRYARLLLGDELGDAWAGEGDGKASEALICALRTHAVSLSQLGVQLPDGEEPWSLAGETPLNHPLHALGITMFDAPPLPGHGDWAAISARTRTHGPSFRAVWNVGNWSSGGIVLPLGESGRMLTAHANDQEIDFTADRLHPL